ncbi:MAG: hypothetical protein ACFCUN_02155 [Hyphomicrobiaceae bacterium]
MPLNIPMAAAVHRTLRTLIGLIVLVLTLSTLASPAHAGCDLVRIEAFLQDRAFELTADEKIALYGERVYRYYDRGELSRRAVYRAMVDWEARWPDRQYEFLEIQDFTETDDRDACRVTFLYRFLAHSPRRNATSAGIGSTTLVIAEAEPDGTLKIVAEWGDVICRGVSAFTRSRC